MMTRLILAPALLLLMALPAQAQPDSPRLSTRDAMAQPPAPGGQGQTWVSPQGCTYSRAQAPGYPATWHLILNGADIGLTNAHRRCPGMLGG